MARSEGSDRPHDSGGGGGRAGGAGRGGSTAKGPGDLPKRSWKDVLKRAGRQFKAEALTDKAAALTYYGVLALFPAALALLSILGLIGKSAIQPLVDNVASVAPGQVHGVLTSVLKQLGGGQGKAGVALAIGIILALWSASGYVAAFMRTSNSVYHMAEGRPAWKALPVRFGITVAVIVLLALTAFGVVVTGTLARKAGNVLGAGDTAVSAWNYAKWPVMVLLVSLAIALLYWGAPNVKRRFRWVTPGSLVAVVIWIIASVAFAFYVANFSSYSKTYGTFAGIIIFLIWLWITNIAILFGLVLNVESERQRAIGGGHPPGDEPFAEPRDTRKL
ncbi:YihY/virulence factor BrkB family protein [Streptomyces sp. NRRL F-5126]|uniref:YihY/virulence factor BrkB family protein n=1 Tax=Streptomyces sp. NRRL F-5126 TaxID=1463857 RepID=UPI00099CF57A|nr:YihY/virulence factor BrkB family protein [Streptomyces sp. NRRL F-5126]